MNNLICYLSSLNASSNPDIMLESYYEHPISVIYFTLYLIVTLYFLNNVVRNTLEISLFNLYKHLAEVFNFIIRTQLLAVVYSSFSDAEMMKFKQLYLHKRYSLTVNVMSSARWRQI
jgi:hypothetical protein